MTFPQKKPKREHNEAHLDFVRQLSCVGCACEGKETVFRSVDAAHVSFLGEKGFGSKVSDLLTVPLCRYHHDEQGLEQHERIWWARLGINPKNLTRDLVEAYPDIAAAEIVIGNYARDSHRTHRLRPAGELSEPTDAAPKRVTLTGHLSNTRDVNGNVGIHLPILGSRGCTTALVHVDPSAVERAE